MKILILQKIQYYNIYHGDAGILHAKVPKELWSNLTKNENSIINDDILLDTYGDMNTLFDIEVMISKKRWTKKENFDFKKLPIKKISEINIPEQSSDQAHVEVICDRNSTNVYIKINSLKSQYQINEGGSVIFEVDKDNTLSGIWLLNIKESDECD